VTSDVGFIAAEIHMFEHRIAVGAGYLHAEGRALESRRERLSVSEQCRWIS
jgi:hypothetical protein